MLFGPSGSGKTVNAKKILNYLQCTSVKVNYLYGKAILKDQVGEQMTLEFESAGDRVKNVKLQNPLPRKKVFDPATKKQKNSTFVDMDAIVTKVTTELTDDIMIRQTVNNPESSRCMVVYLCTLDDGTVFILIDAPGNESPKDIIDSLFKPLKDTAGNLITDEDTLVSLLLSADEVNNKYNGFVIKPLDPKLSNERITIRREHNRIPFGQERVISYCQTLVKESLYINLLIGEMAKKLTPVKGFNQFQPLLMMQEKDGKLTVCKKCSNTRQNCGWQQARFIYQVACDTTTTAKDVHQLNRQNSMKTHFPIEEALDNNPTLTYKAIIVCPTMVRQEGGDAIRNAIVTLMNQVVGEYTVETSWRTAVDPHS